MWTAAAVACLLARPVVRTDQNPYTILTIIYQLMADPWAMLCRIAAEQALEACSGDQAEEFMAVAGEATCYAAGQR